MDRRRGQTAVEVPLALSLLALLVIGAWAATGAVWRAADDAIAREDARRSAQRGGR